MTKYLAAFPFKEETTWCVFHDDEKKYYDFFEFEDSSWIKHVNFLEEKVNKLKPDKLILKSIKSVRAIYPSAPILLKMIGILEYKFQEICEEVSSMSFWKAEEKLKVDELAIPGFEKKGGRLVLDGRKLLKGYTLALLVLHVYLQKNLAEALSISGDGPLPS